jgi:hypothetical protein
MSETQIHFSTSLYDPEGVSEAARAFETVASLTIQKSAEEIIVEIGDYDGDYEVLRDEFRNHALYASILRDQNAPTEAC